MAVVEGVVVVVAAAVAVGATTPALIDKWTVSPSLMPSYSFNIRSSAIALPLYSQRCLSGSGAPLAASCACSCAFREATSAVSEQGRLNDKGGLSDLMVRVMVFDEVDDCASPAAVFAAVDVDDDDVPVSMGSGGCTTGICVDGNENEREVNTAYHINPMLISNSPAHSAPFSHAPLDSEQSRGCRTHHRHPRAMRRVS